MKVCRQKKKEDYLMLVKNKKIRWLAPFKLIFNSFLASLNIFFVILFIASAYSDFISPEKNVLFAYLGLAFPVLLFFNICFFAFWIITKKWLFTFILVGTFCTCLPPLSRFCPVNLKTEITPDENIIKLLSYNVMSFAYKNHTKESPNKIIQYIAESDADIVCLQEYMVSSRQNLMDSKDVARALPMYPYIAEINFSTNNKNNYKYGLAVLSKFPITSSKRIPYKSLYNGSSIHEINVHGKKIVLLNNHLESFKLTTEDRSKYSDMITNVSLESFDELRGSIQQKLGQAFRTRAKQAEIIAKEISNANGYYTIVCGDFNDTPISYACKTVKGPLVDAFEESGLGTGISYNQNFFLFRIDHIFHSSSMNAFNCRVDTRVNQSDHYPIYCYLKIN